MEQLATAKELQRRSVLPFSAGSGEGAQDSCRRAQAKSSPGVLAGPLLPGPRQLLRRVHCNLDSSNVNCRTILLSSRSGRPLASTSKPNNGWTLGSRSFNCNSPVGSPQLSRSRPPRRRRRKTHESMERMSRHVSEVCEKIEAAKARRASVRETISHLQTKLLTESAPREPNPPPSPDPPEQLLRQVWDSADEVARSSDLFSAIRRVVFPDMEANGYRDSSVQASASLGPRDFGCRTGGHRDRGRTDGETHANSRREFAVGPFSQEGAKETKELLVLSSLIPDCRLTAGNLFREASLHDPRSIPSFAQVAAHRGTPTDLWEAFCSLPEAHDHHLVHHVHVFTDGSVDFDETQSSSPVPPSALGAGFSGVVFVACGEELLFWVPSGLLSFSIFLSARLLQRRRLSTQQSPAR